MTKAEINEAYAALATRMNKAETGEQFAQICLEEQTLVDALVALEAKA